MTPDPERIYLEPRCCADPETGRTWAANSAWGPCECGQQPTEYVRADIVAAQRQEIRDLRARLAHEAQALAAQGSP